MSRVTTIHCSRYGATILGGQSIIELKAGPLATRHDEPIDLCSDCVERFEDWLRQGGPDALDGLGGAPSALVVGSGSLKSNKFA